ncbi:MAG TPA: hypothetical protein VHU80_07665, partial [Polyangiaceae bacterium]|nr:hypothetical protein [Polyangiaceae bacterium]
MKSASRSKRPVARVARWVIGLLLGFELLYVVAANLLMQFGGVQAMFASTDAVKADFVRGWTIWPGVLHIEKLKIVVADQNIQCLVGLEHVVLHLRLLQLPGKVFHVTKLRGSGLSLHFRNRVQPEDAMKPFVRALPPVPGFDNPPLYEARAPAPPIPDDKYDLWTVHIEDVDVDIDELWAQQFRYLGHGRARGAFRLKPARSLWVGPATLDLAKGRLLAGADAPFLADFGGRIECTVHAFDVRKPDGREVLRNISTQLDLSGEVAGTQAVQLFVDPAADVRVDQQGARLAVKVGVDHGVATRGSRIELRGDSLAVRQKELRFDASSPWSVVGTADDKGPGGRVEIHFERATLGGRALAAPTPTPAVNAPAAIALENAAVTAASTSRDTAGEWGFAGAALDLGRALVPELRMINELSPTLPVRFTEGSASAAGHVAYDGAVISGKGNAAVKEAKALAGGSEFAGSADVLGDVERFDSAKGTYAFNLDLHANDLRMDDEGRRESCPWGSVGEVKLGAHVSRLPDALPTGKVDGSIEKVLARWGDTTLSGDVVVHTATEKVGGDHAVLRADVRARSVSLRGGSGARARWMVHAPEALVDASFDWGDVPIAGPLRVLVQRAGGTIGRTQMSGDVTADLRVASADQRTRTGEVSGTVRVRNARLSSGERHVEDWWATLNLGPTRVAAKENLDLDGSVSASFRDGLPGLFVLSEGDQIPEWLPDVLPLNGLSGKLGVHRRCRTLDVDVPEISGGPLTASGKISSQPDETRGAVLVRVRGAKVLSA